MINDYDVEMSIKDYTTNQTKFNELVEEFSDSKTYDPLYKALKKARADFVQSYGHPLIGWQGLTNEEAIAFVIRTTFHSYTGEQVVGMSVEKEKMSPIPDTLITIKDVHDAALKQLIDVPKETVKIESFMDVIRLQQQIAHDSRRGPGNYLLINPCFVDDYKELMGKRYDQLEIVTTELMPNDKAPFEMLSIQRCGMVVYSGSNLYDSPVFNAVFDGNGYSCLNPDVERYVRKFEW